MGIQWNSDPLDSINQMVRAKLIVSIGSYNHIPFATGMHKCLGMHLAKLELRTYTTLLVRDWEFELDESKLDEEGTVNRMNVTDSFPHYNVYLKLRRREN